MHVAWFITDSRTFVDFASFAELDHSKLLNVLLLLLLFLDEEHKSVRSMHLFEKW